MVEVTIIAEHCKEKGWKAGAQPEQAVVDHSGPGNRRSSAAMQAHAQRRVIML
jgi:hypothetical protein